MGNAPAASKFDSFREIPKPATWTDLNMLIGMFGFYQKWIERYEICIKPFRLIQTYRPKPGAFSIQEEMNLFQGFWLDEHDDVLHKLKSLILSSPILARPDPDRRFYLKTDWSRYAMAAVLCQADEDDLSRNLEELENQGGPCMFELTQKGIRL